MFELIVRNSFGVKLYFLLNNLLKYDRLSKPTSKEISIIALFVEVNKIDDFSSHAFRDTFATKAIEAGMKPETLQYILGHADIKMTMNLYYHLTDDKKVQEMNIVDYAFQY